MPTISSILDAKFRQAIRSAFDMDADPLVGPAQNEKFGDYQANAAMSLAKTVAEKSGQKTNPRQVAEQVKSKLDLGDMASEISIAGPGFINVRLNPAWLSSLLAQAGASERLGVEPTATPQTVVVDYSGPNIAKELHVGHLRSTIIGDAVVRVLDFQGHRVIKQNHIGDWGTQFGRVILAIWHLCMAERRGDPEYPARTAKEVLSAVKQNDAVRRKQLIEEVARRQEEDYKSDPEGTQYFEPFLERYHADLERLLPAYQLVGAVEEAPEAQQYIVYERRAPRPLASVSKLVTSDLQKGVAANPLSQQEVNAWAGVRAATLESCQRIYDQLGVLLTRADEYGESRYNQMLPAVVDDLKHLGLATESEGAVAVFIDGPGKPPLLIEKAGGEGYLYATTDLAAIRYRVSVLHAQRVIYLVDARQANHFNQVFATARKAGWADDALLEHASFGTMLGEDGKPFKTRSGDTVKLKDLLDEAEERALKLASEKNAQLSDQAKRAIAHAVGIGAVKYSDLSKDRTSDYVFSWDRALAMDGNTAPYLQYAHARIRSIFRKAGDVQASSGQVRLESPLELALAKHLLRFGEVVELVARELKPHHLCNYLYELATRFSSFYENCPVLQSDEGTRASRLALCDLVARFLAKGLDLLGIEHPDQM
ncbi:MAG TPA: arginine--tRNA ligase [Tepidisphaeraceae bacterium]|jgi:arginyl-tRNA synthetase